MAEFVGEHYRIYGKALVCTQVFFPIDGLYIIVHLISRLCLEVLDGFQDTDSGTQTEVRLVQHCFISGESHHAVSNLNVAGAQLCQFFSQHFFQSLESLGYQLEFLLHCM